MGQVTAQSLAGTFGSKLQKLSIDLCRRDAVHVVASDAHDNSHRPFGLSEAYKVIEKELGSVAYDNFRQNSQKIIDNEELIRANYSNSGKKLHRMFGFFSRKG
ncbi:Tyrosine-protein phosphatase YwqE [compost metagenome]